jgi:GPH family glycoside/pentoside/hexuronide:cation symporter
MWIIRLPRYDGVAGESPMMDEKAGADSVVERAPTVVVIGWAIGSIGASVIALTYNLLLLRYMTDFVGIAAGVAAAMIAVSKLYDGVVDPLIGSLSDRTRTRWGRRRPYLLASAVFAPGAMLMLFFVPDFQQAFTTALYIFAALIVFSTSYAIWSVPYMAMAAEITDDYRDRTRLIAYRTAAGTLGQMLAASFGPWLLVRWGGGKDAYEQVAIVMALIISASCLVCFFMTRRARFRDRVAHVAISRGEQLKLVWSNRPFRSLIGSKFFFFGLTATSSASNAYFTKYVLLTSDVWLAKFYVLLTVATTASLPVWLWIGRSVDKKRCMLAGITMVGLQSLSWFAAGPGESEPLMWVRVLTMGAGLGGFILFGQSMLPDTVEYDYHRTGLRREGAFSGIFVLTEKISTAGGVALIGLILSLGGYLAATKGVAAVQPASALQAIRFCFAGLPALGSLAAFLLILPYDLDERRLAEGRTGRR